MPAVSTAPGSSCPSWRVDRSRKRVVAFGGLIADKALDVDWIVAELDERGAQVVTSQHPRRTGLRTIDADLYRWRHLIENFFGELKDFKRIAMRACKPTPASQP